MRRAITAAVVVVSLASTGCETSTAIKNQQYHLAMARTQIEDYRVPDRKEFFGFVLGDELKGRGNYHGTPDEETGGIHYTLPDPQGMFDFVSVQADQRGLFSGYGSSRSSQAVGRVLTSSTPWRRS